MILDIQRKMIRNILQQIRNFDPDFFRSERTIFRYGFDIYGHYLGTIQDRWLCVRYGIPTYQYDGNFRLYGLRVQRLYVPSRFHISHIEIFTTNGFAIPFRDEIDLIILLKRLGFNITWLFAISLYCYCANFSRYDLESRILPTIQLILDAEFFIQEYQGTTR